MTRISTDTDEAAVLRAWMTDPNTTSLQQKGDAGYACIHRFLFTYAILAGLSQHGYDDRWCYKTYDAARTALDAWDGRDGTEPGGWHKHPDTGRRRDENGNETVNF